MNPKPEGFIQNDITGDPGTLSNGVAPDVQFAFVVMCLEMGVFFHQWWDAGYARPPRNPQIPQRN